MSILDSHKNIELLCEFHGGSHLYGLNTPASDIDVRGVFANTHPDYILGTKRFEEARKQVASEQEDIVYKEVSHFIRLLQQSNTEALEILYAPESSFTILSDSMKVIRSHQDLLVDSERLFKCLCGYMQGELRLALGERKGQIGGKRYEAVQKYGFSPKNFVQLFRLAFVGTAFFNSGKFYTRVPDGDFRDWLMAIKTNPGAFNRDQLVSFYNLHEEGLKKAFDSRKVDRKFDEETANELLFAIYSPHLKRAQEEVVKKLRSKAKSDV